MAEHSPTPWRVSHGYIVLDADGTSIANAWRDADAAFIVEAVNDYEWALGEIHKMTVERDRIRDLVKRIEEEVDRCHKRDGQISQYLIDAVYEARAIGEAQP